MSLGQRDARGATEAVPPHAQPPIPEALRPPEGTLALVFDLDGTLIDTMPAHYEAWRIAVGRYGITFTEERFYALAGVPTREILELLSSEAGVTLDTERVCRERDALFVERIDSIRPHEAVLGVARAWHGKVPLAIATGGRRFQASHILEHFAHLGLSGLFDAIVTADDVTRHKPAPDVFLEAARRVGAPAERCCAYEDADLGLAAARAARMHAIDVRPVVQKR